jgi:DNA-nicking Smr family endonuclease
MRRGPKHDPALDEHDKALWRKLAETVRPLKRKRPPPPPAAEAAPKASPRPAPVRTAKPAPPAKPAPARPAQQPEPPPLSHGDAPGVDRRAFKRVRRARLYDADVLDLHGMTQAAAHAALIRFLERARKEGRTTVRVITGKGRRGERERGVLQDAVPMWLNDAAVRPFIQAFNYASPDAGGSGALDILLRRAKTAARAQKPAPQGSGR